MTAPTESWNPLDRAALVVAHPDDECLWFSSVMADVDEIVFCYEEAAIPGLGERRRKAIARHPLTAPRITSLALPEPNTFHSTRWHPVTVTPQGLAQMSRRATRRYTAHLQNLVAALRPQLCGRNNVITHNPWGEYGHADHAQVFRAVQHLSRELGFHVWFTNYGGGHCADAVASCMSTGLVGRNVKCATQPVIANEIAAHYRRHGCWTWYEHHTWPAEELLVQTTPQPQRPQGNAPLRVNLLDVDFIPGARARPRSLTRRVASGWQRLTGSHH